MEWFSRAVKTAVLAVRWLHPVIAIIAVVRFVWLSPGKSDVLIARAAVLGWILGCLPMWGFGGGVKFAGMAENQRLCSVGADQNAGPEL